VIGDGPERFKIKEAAQAEPWIHDLGSKNDHDKVPFWAMAKLLLMPGLVGLVVVDSFALGVPLVTTDYPFHSPEIDYLKDGENGCVVPCGDDPSAYADAVVALLRDPDRIERLKAGAIASAAEHTIENMAKNFANGVMRCIGNR
jgi:glycosyltransferase involved in cell wall biosynthesis